MKTSQITEIITPRPKYTFHAQNYTLGLGQQTKIMGIVNMTPDSFSRDGCLIQERTGPTTAIRLAKKMIRQGADIIDIGGESSRPGSNRITAQEEIDRIIPVISKLSKHMTVPISVDTYKPLVAKHALDAGANIVNNIKGIASEKSLLKMIRDYDAAIVLMHMQGTPKTMQRHTSYTDLIAEILSLLKNSVEKCLEIGIKSDKIIIDPGIGFGKTVEHNLEIINRLELFHELNQPILIGTSRKSFIGKILNKDVDQRLMGTAASVCASIIHGAHIVRVHDVGAIKDTVDLTDAIININRHSNHN